MTKGATTETKVVGAPVPKRQSRVASMIKELEVVGPNLAEVARRLHEPKESVSYIFRSILQKNGYVVQARLDLGALGLRDAVAIVNLSDDFSANAADVFDDMDDHWFLFGFSRTLPDGRFMLHFALPEDHYGEFQALLDGMRKSKLVSDVHEVLDLSWRRHLPMRSDIYDFKRGKWEFDWSQAPPACPFRPPERSQRQKFDTTDIAILASMISDASTPLKTVAKYVRVSSKTAYRHAEHIAKAGFVPHHRVNWLRTHMNSELGKPFSPRHRFAFTNVLVRSVCPEEIGHLSEGLGVLPFLWFEAGGADYLAELAIPLEQMVETMSYLREVLEPVADRSSTYLGDTAYSRGYSPPRFLVDDSKGEWKFDLDEQMQYLSQQLDATRSRAAAPQAR